MNSKEYSEMLKQFDNRKLINLYLSNARNQIHYGDNTKQVKKIAVQLKLIEKEMLKRMRKGKSKHEEN